MECTIKNLEKKESKSGEYLQLTLLNNETKEQIKGMLWADALKKHDVNIFKRNAVLDIKESTYNKNYDNYDIKQVELIKEGKVGLDETKRLELYNNLTQQAGNIQDEKLRDFTLRTLSKSKNSLLSSVAAKSHHHAYIGGLLQHTHEVLEASLSLCCFLGSIGKESSVNFDFIIAGAILHDIFKIKEYDTDIEAGSASMNKEWMEVNKNHLRFGWYWAMKNEQKEVAHIIESHHGLLEWGAEQVPHSTEAWIVHLADMASSKMGHMDLSEL